MAGAAIAGVTGIAGLLEADVKADGIKRQAEYDARNMEFNSRMLMLQREDLLAQSETDIVQRQKQVKQVLGAQKVSLAAQGIDVDSDLAAELEDSERQIGIEDVHALKNNAWNQAMGLEVQAMDNKLQARSTRSQAKNKSRQTLISAGIGAVGSMTKAYTSYKP